MKRNEKKMMNKQEWKIYILMEIQKIKESDIAVGKKKMGITRVLMNWIKYFVTANSK